ncbi:MAG: hypothetical protein HWD85_12155 [Flavobacteriaceae bacterium]|nr:hypothetical protein [Flavobacteriaceae bacterium]
MKNLRIIITLLIFANVSISCVKSLDFEQIDNFSPNPIYTTTLAYFTLNQQNFYNPITSTDILFPIEDISQFTVLENSYIRKNLLKVELDFALENQFDRQFELKLDFLDVNNNITHTFTPFVVAPMDANFTRKETIQIANNRQFLSTKKIRISIQMSPSSNGSNLDPNQERKLRFKSAGTFFLKT